LASKRSRTRSSTGKRGKSAAASASRKHLTTPDHTTARIRPSYWAFLRAATALIEAAKPVTQVNLANELRVRRQTVWCFLRRHPDAWAFVDEQLSRANANYFALIQRRHAILGMQGSVASAEVYFKSHAGHYARASGAEGLPLSPGTFNMTFLIPRPELPGLPAPVAAPPPAVAAGGLIPRPPAHRPDIPTVAVR
jgi:hypothetical protein